MMQVVINISDEVYKRILKDEYKGKPTEAEKDILELLNAVENGTVITEQSDAFNLSSFRRVIEKYKEIVKLMDSVIMNPLPDCRPIKSTSRKKVYMTLYKIQKVIGKIRFVSEEKAESEVRDD